MTRPAIVSLGDDLDRGVQAPEMLLEHVRVELSAGPVATLQQRLSVRVKFLGPKRRKLEERLHVGEVGVARRGEEHQHSTPVHA